MTNLRNEDIFKKLGKLLISNLLCANVNILKKVKDIRLIYFYPFGTFGTFAVYIIILY